jgi:D-3-phosphoglycerate dehydrogenase
MNIVILDDYQDAVRKLACAAKLENYQAKVYTNTVKGLGQLSVRLKDADVIVLIRSRTHINRQLIDKVAQAQNDLSDRPHREPCRCAGLYRAGNSGCGRAWAHRSAPAELTWALILAAMRRLPQYIGNLKHGAWQQSGLKSASMPANFGLGHVLHGKTLGVWGYGNIGQIVAGYGRAFRHARHGMGQCRVDGTKPCQDGLHTGPHPRGIIQPK